MSTLYRGEPIEGTHVFTGEMAARAYQLNKLAGSLKEPENRKAFLADETAYMQRYRLSEAEQAMVTARDWTAMVAHGGTVYLILKIAATVGSNLLEMGAQMRGESLPSFMQSRPGPSARPRHE